MPALTTGSGEAELLPEPSSETWEAAQVSRLTLSPDVSFVGVPVGAGPDGGCWPLGQCWAWMCRTRKKRDVNQSSLPLSTPPSLRLHLPPSGPALTIPLQNHPRHLGSGPRASLDRDPVPKGGFHLSCPCCHLPGITGSHGRVASYGLDGKGTTPGSPQTLFQGLFVFLNSFPASPCPSYSYSCSQKNVREGPSSPRQLR